MAVSALQQLNYRLKTGWILYCWTNIWLRYLSRLPSTFSSEVRSMLHSDSSLFGTLWSEIPLVCIPSGSEILLLFLDPYFFLAHKDSISSDLRSLLYLKLKTDVEHRSIAIDSRLVPHLPWTVQKLIPSLKSGTFKHAARVYQEREHIEKLYLPAWEVISLSQGLLLVWQRRV